MPKSRTIAEALAPYAINNNATQRAIELAKILNRERAEAEARRYAIVMTPQ